MTLDFKLLPLPNMHCYDRMLASVADWKRLSYQSCFLCRHDFRFTSFNNHSVVQSKSIGNSINLLESRIDSEFSYKLGIKIHHYCIKTKQDISSNIGLYLIEDGCPIIALVDSFCLPKSPHYHKNHFHSYIVIVGYLKNIGFTYLDTYNTDNPILINYNDFNESIIEYMRFSFEEPSADKHNYHHELINNISDSIANRLRYETLSSLINALPQLNVTNELMGSNNNVFYCNLYQKLHIIEMYTCEFSYAIEYLIGTQQLPEKVMDITIYLKAIESKWKHARLVFSKHVLTNKSNNEICKSIAEIITRIRNKEMELASWFLTKII